MSMWQLGAVRSSQGQLGAVPGVMWKLQPAAFPSHPPCPHATLLAWPSTCMACSWALLPTCAYVFVCQ